MLDQLGIDQPAWQELTSLDDVKDFVKKVGYPVLVRPSYVLSGAAMNVCYDQEELERFLQMASEVSKRISGSCITIHAGNQGNRIRCCGTER